MRREADIYSMRLESFGGGTDLGFLLKEREGHDIGAALVRKSGESATLITLRCRTLKHVAPSVAAIGRELRRTGSRRMITTVLDGTPFARAMTRGGFIRRNEACAIVALGLTHAGNAVAKGLATSDIEEVDVD